MVKRMLAVTIGLAAFISSCGGDSSSPTPPAPPAPGVGALYIFVADAPFCDVLTMRANVTGLTLTPKGGGAGVSLIGSNASVKVNFAALRDFSSILTLANIPEGTYDQATITLSVPQLTVFEPSESPPTKSLTANLTTMAPNVTIEPALEIVKNKVSAVRLELDLIRSVEVNAQGQVTGNVTPTFRLTPLTPAGDQGFGEMDDLIGFVRAVTTTSPGQGFTGSFLMQLFSSSLAGLGGPAVSVNLTNTTQLFGVEALNQLPTGSFVEVNGFVDENGNVVANSVEVEDREFPEQNKVAYVGFVTALTRDSGGTVTGFNLFVHEVEPDVFDVPADSTVVVSVAPTTVFQFSSRGTNFPNLPFDSTALAVGQEVVVHGKFTRPPAATPPDPTPPTTVAADKVYLKLQTLQGNFSSLLQTGSDNKTGAFRFTTCRSLLAGPPIFVFTNSRTAFVNVNGLSGLTPRPALLVKGLPFFRRQAGTIQGVLVPAGALVIVAKQVHPL